MYIEETFRGKPIRCRIVRHDVGASLLISGGDRSHAGAASLALPGEAAATSEFPGHRDGRVSSVWAERLARKLGEPVSVVCGIHYDDLTSEELRQLLILLEGMEARAEGLLLQQPSDQTAELNCGQH